MTTPRRHGAAGFRWEKFRELVFATYGDTCWLCHHGGARQVDHVESLTERPELAFTLANCRPAHGAPRNKCQVCGQNCNQLRGGYSAERARKIIAERSGIAIPEPKPEPPGESGREW